MNTILTESPSERIEFALEALEEFEANPNCVIDMNHFHYINGSVCFACFGGAAAIKRANKIGELIQSRHQLFDSGDWLDIPVDQLDSNGAKLDIILQIGEYEASLDRARVGNVSSMFRRMGLDSDDGSLFDREICYYSGNSERFKSQMKQLAADLREAGY